jgi:hypothetical protein
LGYLSGDNVLILCDLEAGGIMDAAGHVIPEGSDVDVGVDGGADAGDEHGRRSLIVATVRETPNRFTPSFEGRWPPSPTLRAAYAKATARFSTFDGHRGKTPADLFPNLGGPEARCA